MMNRNVTSIQTESNNSRILMKSSEPISCKSLLQKIVRFEKEITTRFEELYEIRIIEKIARPIQREKKLILIKNFKQILDSAHQKMEIMENEFDLNSFALDRQFHRNEKAKKRVEMNVNAKLSFFNIRKKYLEVLVNSSFVHYKTVTAVSGIEEPIEVLDVEKWLTNCLQRLQKSHGQGSKNICC